jgi:hypothetical protein
VADIRGSEDARRVAELERVKRDLKVSLSLAAPGSPVAVPILAQLSAIDAEPGARTAGGPVRICSSGSAADDPGWLEEPRPITRAMTSAASSSCSPLHPRPLAGPERSG